MNLNIKINDITAIDNNPISFLEQKKIIKIKPWFIGDSKNDNALLTTFKDVLKFNTIKVLS